MGTKAIRVDVDGTYTILADNQYETLREGVGGWIEHVALSRTLGFYCNEEGKIHGLPYNEFGTELMAAYFGFESDVIVGPIVLVGGVDEEGDHLDLDDTVVAEILTLLEGLQS